MPIVERQEPCRTPNKIALYDELAKRHIQYDIPEGKYGAAMGAVVAKDHATLSEILGVRVKI